MTILKMICGAAAALVLAPVAACAQPAERQASTIQKGRAQSAALKLQDFVARNQRKLMAADTDGDGKISRIEFLAVTKAGRGDPARRFARIDRNGDGVLDKPEIEAMLTKRFKHLDADGDGVLTLDERSGARTEKRARAVDGSAP